MTMTEEPGKLTIVVDDQLMASLHYLTLSPTSWVLEQVFVRPHQSITLAVQLVKRFTELATTAQVTVKLLDPYAKAYFSEHPAPALLAAHQLPVHDATAVRPVPLTHHSS